MLMHPGDPELLMLSLPVFCQSARTHRKSERKKRSLEQFPCNSAHGAADLAWMQKVQVLHCVDCYTCECLPFFLRPKSIQRWIRFYKPKPTWESLLAERPQLGQWNIWAMLLPRAKRKKKCLKATFSLPCTSFWCSRDAPPCSREAMDFFRCHWIFCWFQCQLLSIFAYIISCRCCSAAWRCEAFELHTILQIGKIDHTSCTRPLLGCNAGFLGSEIARDFWRLTIAARKLWRKVRKAPTQPLHCLRLSLELCRSSMSLLL